MQTKLFKKMAVVVTACTIVSCGIGDRFVKLAMDSPEAVNKVKELVAANVDPNEWKIVELEWDEGRSDDQKLGNNLNQGNVFMKMVKKNGQVFTQGFVGQLGFNLTGIEPDFWYEAKLNYEKITPIDVEKLDAEAIICQVEEAKKMIPEEYEFKSLAKYQIKAGIPSDREGKGEYTDKSTACFTLNVVEKGNETVSNGGKTTVVYYEVDFEVATDGTLTMKE